MRCTNCGWNNPDDLKFCQKCNEPLIVYELHSTPLPIDHNSDKPENSPEPHVEPATEPAQLTCRKCGYPLLADTEFCPNCGAQIKTPANKEGEIEIEEPVEVAVSKDQTDGRATKKFTPEVMEEAEKQVHSFANVTVRDFEHGGGEKVSLKETRRDASNIQIPLNNQAPSQIILHPIDIMGIEGEAISLSDGNAELSGISFSINNGKWEVNSQSSKTVFIQITRPYILESDDILIIDGRKYRVE